MWRPGETNPEHPSPNNAALMRRRLFSTVVSLQPPRGMQDMLPGGVGVSTHGLIQSTFWRVAEGGGYERVTTPLLESTSLYERSLGGESEVVSKEMYTFHPRKAGGESLTLRPEGTAGVLRALLQGGVHRGGVPVRVAYGGPMFRYERPQRGRLRQFTQVGVEVVGGGRQGPGVDVEVIAMAHDFLRAALPPTHPPPTLLLNSLGGDTRVHSKGMGEYFGAHAQSLSLDSQARLARGSPLRILDSKDPLDAPFVAAAPPLTLTPEDTSRYTAVQQGLRDLGVPFTHTPTLVRGLDYYTHTIFEFKVGSLAVVAGGRYDGLPASLGATIPTPCMGWAAGVERLAMLHDDSAAGGGVKGGKAGGKKGSVVVIAVEEGESGGRQGQEGGISASTAALLVWKACRLSTPATPVIPGPVGGNVGKLLSKAAGMGARVCIIVGEDEVRGGCAQVKDLASGVQVTVGVDYGGLREGKVGGMDDLFAAVRSACG